MADHTAEVWQGGADPHIPGRLVSLSGTYPGRLPQAQVARHREGDTVEASVIAGRIGPAQFASMPGEPLPVVGLAVKDLMKADYRFFFGLGDDELGYLLHAEAVDDERYGYEQSMSINKNAVPLLMEQLRPLIEATE